jgi:hypothetical protein
MLVLLVRRVLSDSRAWISAWMLFSALSMALCWASRPGRLLVVCLRVCCRCDWSARPRLCSSMSFSGFGGMGGAGRLVSASDGIERTRGASSRSGGGGGFW